MAVKEQDLNKIIYEMVDDVISIDRPNRDKVCAFIVNLVENGGRKEQAAIDAGYSKTSAGTQAHRLLSNDKINAVYEKLLSHRFVSEIFRKSLTKDHLINLCYQIAMRSFDTAPSQAVKAIEQICKIAGYYEPTEVKNKHDYADLMEELSKFPMIARAFEEQGGNHVQ